MVSSSSCSLPPAPNEKSYKIVTRANDLFERHLYSDAILDYTKVLQLSKDLGQEDNAYLALVYSNRSASYLKINETEKSRLDAIKAIELARHWPKVV
jgi:tetratricopeptide (TPR) repeat protein